MTADFYATITRTRERLDQEPGYRRVVQLAQQLGLDVPKAASTKEPYLPTAAVGPLENMPHATTTLLLDTVSTLGPDIVTIVQDLHAQGVRVYTPDTGTQPLTTHLPILTVLSAAFEPLRSRIDELERTLATIETHYEARHRHAMEAAVSTAHAAMSGLVTSLPRYGAPAPASNGHDTQPLHEVVAAEANARYLTASQLAERIGVAHTTVSRWLTTGKGGESMYRQVIAHVYNTESQ